MPAAAVHGHEDVIEWAVALKRLEFSIIRMRPTAAGRGCIDSEGRDCACVVQWPVERTERS